MKHLEKLAAEIRALTTLQKITAAKLLYERGELQMTRTLLAAADDEVNLEMRRAK